MIAGETNVNGIYDPSVEYDSAGVVGWLAYSYVYGPLVPWGPNVETHLARSLDHGATWTFEQVVNASLPVTLTLLDGTSVDGVWNYEVATLVHDPDDPGREWKLFAHRIFRKAENNFEGEQNLPAYSWIVFRWAADPAGAWSSEVPLMSSGPLPPAPYDLTQVAINDLDPSLAGLLVYSEPGGFYRDGVLYLSLTGLVLTGPDRIVLLASDDHGQTWRYVGTPLSNADAASIGYLKFDGSSIVEDAGRVFLLASPQSQTVVHDGTLVFEFTSLGTGELFRDGTGAPSVRKHVPPQPDFLSERGAGQSDYHAGNWSGGLLMPQLNLPDFPEFFQIFATGERPATPTGAPVLAPVAGSLLLAALTCAALRLLSQGRNRTAPP